MSESYRSLGVLGDERAFGSGSGTPVVPDRGGEGEEADADPGVNAGDGAAAVLLGGELALQGVEHGLDPLPDPGQVPVALRLVAAVRAEDVRVEFVADEGFELAAGEALVADQDLAGADLGPVVVEELGQGCAFPDLR